VTAASAVLHRLREARAAAADVGASPWDFAVEIDRLRDLGLTNSDLRWLAARGYVEHAVEKPGRRGHRAFEAPDALRITDRTSVVITDAGLAYLAGRRSPGRGRGARAARVKPSWDAGRRELRLGGRLVKRFRQPAGNQELILAGFQELGWPEVMDNPLPGPPAEQAEHLRSAIKRLNGHQQTPLLRFRGDGTGKHVRWEPR
jgi:hypothetical protein